MERKIGEIFEYNGEWYQCVEGKTICSECDLRNIICQRDTSINNPFKECSGNYRTDKKNIIFKKLEKVGEPYRRWLSPSNNIMVQRYRLYGRNVIMPDEPIMLLEPNYKNSVEIEIKQTKEDMGENNGMQPYDELFSPGTVSNTKYLAKEDMEENKTSLPKEDNALTRTVYAYVNGKISDKELIRSIKEMSDEYPYNKNNLKPFSLELAREGKPVCTRDGRRARLICFDKKGAYPIVALVNNYNEEEYIKNYDEFGKKFIGGETSDDLMMLPEKKEGWINVYKERCYESKKEAIRHIAPGTHYIGTIRVEWEDKE